MQVLRELGIQKFEDLIAWQKAQDLAVNVYSEFPELKDFSFKDQIQRASVSISNNIAEGFDRSSSKDFVRFLYMSLSSASEVKSMLYLGLRLEYLNNQKVEFLLESANEVSKISRGLIRSLTTDN